MILGAVFVSILGTLLHFAYEFSGENYFVGLFTPVNESVWEHMKLLFFPMLVFSLFSKEKLSPALMLGTLSGTFLIPVLFYTYTGFLGFNIGFIDILIFYISVIFAFYVSYKSSQNKSFEKYKGMIFTLICILFVLFIVFTVFPPQLPIFIAP